MSDSKKEVIQLLKTLINEPARIENCRVEIVKNINKKSAEQPAVITIYAKLKNQPTNN